MSFGRVVDCGRAKCAQKAEAKEIEGEEGHGSPILYHYQPIKMHVVVVSF
jgi:hypothetical protein